MILWQEVAKLEDDLKNLKNILKFKDKTIESLKTEKYTLYGNGYGFLATDIAGNQVWVNSISIALRQKDEEIKELRERIKALTEKTNEN